MRDFGFSLDETVYGVKFVEADDAANDPLEEEEDGEHLEYLVLRVYTQAEMDAAVEEATSDGYNQGYDEGFEHGFEEGASK